MRVVIVGAGAVGIMTAWRLARAGQEVVALEQFRIDHNRGSSYGDSRIVRRVYPDPLYTTLMADAYRLWDELIGEAGDSGLLVQTGGIFCGAPDHPQVQAAQEALAASRVPHGVLDAAECARRFPAFRLESNEVAVYEPSMGYARASRCVRAAAELARLHGAQIREECEVGGMAAVAGGGVRVTLKSGETLIADRLIVTAGAWTKPLLEPLGVNLPLVVTRQPYVHLRPAHNAEYFETGRFPVWIDAPANAYGFPRLGDLPGVKLGLHDRGETVTPETVVRTVQEADRKAARRFAARRFPDLSSEIVYEKVCLYTNTPDEDFIVDAVPGLPGAFVLSACSGHGFKFAPLMGRVAADLVRDRPIPYDLTRFGLARFIP
jgi:sarcosine oxidase